MEPAVELINGWNLDAIGALASAPFAGSFLGVLILRLPQGREVVWGRSCCAACGQNLAPRDLVPLVSFFVTGGRCRQCAAPIPRVHLWVELAALATAAWAVSVFPDGALLWASCLLGWMLLALGWIDAVSGRLPDALTLKLLLAGLAEAFLAEPDALTGRALAAAAGYGAFRGLSWVYRRLRGRDGLGQGDAKLLGAAGAWVGLLGLPYVILAASLGGLAYALLLRLRGERVDGGFSLPFGPFLAMGIWVVWLYAPALFGA